MNEGLSDINLLREQLECAVHTQEKLREILERERKQHAKEIEALKQTNVLSRGVIRYMRQKLFEHQLIYGCKVEDIFGSPGDPIL